MVYGSYRDITRGNKIAVYERRYQDDCLLVAVTDGEEGFKPPFDLSGFRLILNNYAKDALELLPYQAKVYYGKAPK